MEIIKKITKREGLIAFLLWIFLPFSIWIVGLAEIATVTLTIMMFRMAGRRIDYKVSKKEVLKMFGIILLALVFQVIWGIFSTEILKISSDSENQNTIVKILQQGGWNTAFMLFGVLINAPFMEELVFRGWIQEYTGKNKRVGFAASWFLFAAIHLIASLRNDTTLIKLLVEFVPYGVLSFIFCWYYYKYENIGKNIILHFINNFVATILVFLPIILS